MTTDTSGQTTTPAPMLFAAPAEYLRQADRDRALLRRIASGDEDALGTLYDAYAPLLNALAVRMLRSVADAEDVLQEVFLEVWRNPLRSGEGTNAARLVLFTRERALLRVRARGHKRGHHPLDAGGSPSLRAAGALGTEMDFAKGSPLAAAAAALPGGAQKVLALAFHEGLALSEIAELLETPGGSVLAQIGASLNALQKAAPVATLTACTKGADFPSSAAAAALSALDGEELRLFEAHLATPCGTCRADIAGYREIAALLPLLLPQARLASDVKERILFAIRLSQVAAADLSGAAEPAADGVPELPPTEAARTESPDAAPRRSWLLTAAVFAGLVVLVGTAAYINTLHQKVEQQYAFIQDQETAMAKMMTNLDARRAVLGVLESPALEVVALHGVGAGAGSHGKLLWDKTRNEAVMQISHPEGIKEEEEYRLRVAMKDHDTLTASLSALDSSEARRAYFVVRSFPAAAPGTIESFVLVRARRGAETAGVVVMLGGPPAR